MKYQLNDCFGRLDEIEKTTPWIAPNEEILALMEGAAQEPHGLRLLVKKYGGSISATLAGGVAFILAKEARRRPGEAAPLILEFISSLTHRDKIEILGTSLSAIQEMVIEGLRKGVISPPSSSLFSFLQHCLNFSARGAVLVQDGAVEVLNVICDSKLIEAAFDAEQIRWICEKVEQLSQTENEMLGESVVHLKACLSNHAINPSQ